MLKKVSYRSLVPIVNVTCACILIRLLDQQLQALKLINKINDFTLKGSHNRDNVPP